MENLSNAHVVSLLCKLNTSSRDSVDLFIGFDRDRNRRQRDLTNNRDLRGKYQNIRKYYLRLFLKDLCGFAEGQEKATLGLSYKLTLTRNNANAALNKENGTSEGKIKTNNIEWFVPHYTPSVQEQVL